jgi:citrate lyase gamma subunit
MDENVLNAIDKLMLSLCSEINSRKNSVLVVDLTTALAKLLRARAEAEKARTFDIKIVKREKE